MWYTLGYANTLICAPAHRGRAGYARDRSPSAFTVRRCQILLASAEGQSTTTIACHLRCTDQTVRNVIHAFHQRGLAVLQPQSSRPQTASMVFDARACEVPPGAFTPESTSLRQAHQRVAPAARCRGQFRPGPHAAAGQRRNDSSCPAPVAGILEACQAWYYQPRSGLCAKKNDATG
jgi:hypothetical protein